MMKKTTTHRTLTTAAALALSVATAPLLADTEFEWDPTWGLHEEEWYDPSDWLNDDGVIDVEESGTLTYDVDYYADDFWADTGYYTTYAYDDDAFDTEATTVYYQWVPVTGTWVTVESSETGQKREAASKTAKNTDSASSRDISKENVVTMKGEIVGMTTLTPSGSDEAHRFLILEADEGKNVIVDCGATTDSKEMTFKKGDSIQVRGTRAKAGGRYVLLAQQVSGLEQ